MGQASPRPEWQLLREGRVRDGVVVVILAAAVAAFFWPVLFNGASVPKGGGDLASFLFPAYAFAAEQLQRGVLPLWNPYLFAGSPFAADVQSGLYYPPNLIAFLLARPFTYQSLEALAIVHYFLAALFAYSYGRGIGLRRTGSIAVALVFAYGGFSVAHLAHYNMLAAAVWLPLVLLFFHKSLEHRHLGWAAGSGAAFGVAVLAGHTQIVLFIAFFLFLYWLYALVTEQPTSRVEDVPVARRTKVSWLFRTREGRVLLASLPFAGLIGVLLAAVQLIPLAELLRLSLRADITFAKALEFSASPLGLITLVVPHFFGDSAANYWGLRWSLTEVYGYAGILTWALLALVIWVARPRWRWPAFFTFIALLALLLSMGEHTALYGWLYRFVPGFDKVRAAGRFLLLFDFALAVLAGYGVDVLGQPLSARKRPAYRQLLRAAFVALGGAVFLVAPIFYYALMSSQDKDAVIVQRLVAAIDSVNLTVVFLALTVVLLVAYRRRWSRFLPALAIILLAVDLFSANAVLNPTNEDVLRGFEHPAVVQYLRKMPEPARIDSAAGAADIWQPDSGLLYDLPDVSGLYNPMILADYQHYWESLGSRSVPGYDLLNAGYLVGRKDLTLDRAKFELAFDGDPQLNVYSNRSVLPRAFIVGKAEIMPREAQLARLREVGFDPRQTVLLESTGAPTDQLSLSGIVKTLGYPNPNEIVVGVDSAGPGYLVLSEVYYPGWRAFVDGREAPVLRADYLFRAVALPAGAREVHLRFEPRSWQIGLAISLVTLLALSVYGIRQVFAFRMNRPYGGEPSP